MKYRGEIIRGKIKLEKEDIFKQQIAKLDGKKIILILRKIKKLRSRQEEKYYHAVVIPMIADAMSITKEEAHDFLKMMFLKSEESCMIQGGIVLRYERIRSTTELTSEEYRNFWSRCVNWAALPTIDGLNYESGLGIYIPLPNENFDL